MPETPLITYLKIQKATDQQVLSALRSSAASVDQELRRLQNVSRPGEQMRKQQLLRSQAEINRQLLMMFNEVGDITGKASAKAAAVGAETILRESKDVLKRMIPAGEYEVLERSIRESAVQSLEAAMQRVSGSSYIPLADSVWGNQRRANSVVNSMVTDAIATGMSASDLAKKVREYVNPNTPGGTRYAAMRLARTELNNAFHASQIAQAMDEPWTLAVKWHLSGSHPRPDECNDYADDVHYKDGKPGHWLPEEVPGKPHPNCLCYTTPVVMDEDEFIDAYLKGGFDDYLDDQGLPSTALSSPMDVKANLPRWKDNSQDLSANSIRWPREGKPFADPTGNTLERSGWDNWIRPVRSQEVNDAIARYVDYDFADDINTALRSGVLTPEIQEQVKLLDAATNLTASGRPTVYRGMMIDDSLLDYRTPGAVVHNQGYLSTSSGRGLAEDYLEMYGDPDLSYVLEIQLESDVKFGIGMWDPDGEFEAVLSRHTDLHIVSVSEESRIVRAVAKRRKPV